jgi:2-methylcitrate dehydratase PrpD
MDTHSIQFIHAVTWDDLPDAVRGQARRCLLDTLAAGIGGRSTPLSGIIHDYTAAAYGGRGAYLWFDGRQVSPPGAALANGMTVDALDIHDGHMPTKGHAGAAVVPGLLATLALQPSAQSHAALSASAGVTGRELLATLAMSYEVAIRAGIALHATVCDYHTSGAWNALGCAAIGARRLGLSPDATRHALGIAEYHGPRSQMMRCIDYPTMLKDGSGWGAMAGVSAALMAAGGFTGAPAITVAAPEVAQVWADLGSRWRILEQYFKPHAVCRWAQPPVEAALAMQQAHGFHHAQVTAIRVATFHEAACLDVVEPHSTEEAQYSLPFAVAAALVHGSLGPEAVSGAGLADPQVLALAQRVQLTEDPDLSPRFPAERVAHVEIEIDSGERYALRDCKPRWEADDAPSDDDLRQKFRRLAAGRLLPEHAAELEDVIWHCADLPDAGRLLTLLAQPAGEQAVPA